MGGGGEAASVVVNGLQNRGSLLGCRKTLRPGHSFGFYLRKPVLDINEDLLSLRKSLKPFKGRLTRFYPKSIMIWRPHSD
jgi:hypothetical protein